MFLLNTFAKTSSFIVENCFRARIGRYGMTLENLPQIYQKTSKNRPLAKSVPHEPLPTEAQTHAKMNIFENKMNTFWRGGILEAIRQPRFRENFCVFPSPNPYPIRRLSHCYKTSIAYMCFPSSASLRPGATRLPSLPQTPTLNIGFRTKPRTSNAYKRFPSSLPESFKTRYAA